MKLIAGLGNPGSAYQKSRHNAGFMAAEALLAQLPAPRQTLYRSSPLFSFTVHGEEIVALFPMSYMNLSGEVIAPFMAERGLSPEELLVIHDDIDLPLGEVRYKEGGGHAGHNGLRSIIDHLSSRDFKRIRIGVGRPPEGMTVTDYVLHPFLYEEWAVLEEAIGKAILLIDERFARIKG